ncbi:MAG: MBL fold metallo-hydrolase [Bacteriovoracaceae bacterium]
MIIEFLGATEDVTGSMTLVELPEGKILIDSGLYQGINETEEKNQRDLSFQAKEIKAILLTHAHLDHSGFLPVLFKKGFRGTIYCTKATMKLVKIILEDSAKLQENNEQSFAPPLYDSADVTKTLSLLKSQVFGEWFTILGAQISFHPAGHILGAASIEISCNDKTIIFSGDLGRHGDPLLSQPMKCPKADLIVMESTYGGRMRIGDMEKELYSFLVDVSREKKVGIIASFAIARGQLLIHLIEQFFERHPDEKIRLVMDSPMMNEANKVYQEFIPKLKATFLNIDIIESLGEWNSLKKKDGPLIILSSSGMLSGGRIWRHIKNWQHSLKAVLFLPGFQGMGTAGRDLSEGIRDVLSLDGEKIHWSGEILSSSAFSSHADQSELIEWLGEDNKIASVFLIHGEDRSKEELKKKLEEIGYNNVQIPYYGTKVKV